MRRQAFYFSGGPYLQALQGLHSALCEPGAFVKLVGQPRTGKSTVCEKLTQFLQRKDYQVVYFDYAIESPEMLRAMLAQELNLPGSFNLTSQLEDLLIAQPDKEIVIVFDDAHLLTDITLLEIYRLTDIQLNGKRIINILLCGEPSLEKRLLDKQEFQSLHHRVSHNFVLDPMDADTTALFLTAYLAKAGLPELHLEAPALAYFYKSCKGFPGLAGSIAHLLVAQRAEQSDLAAVSKDELLGLIKNADDGEPLPTLQYLENNQWLALGPLTAVLVIASLAILYQQLSGSELAETEQPATDELSTFVAAGPEIPAAANPVPIESIDVAEVFIEEEAETLENEQTQLDNSEPEPVSDSNLSLVTAEEIGLTAADIVEPVFEDLLIDSSAAVVRLAVGEDITATTISLSDAVGENDSAVNVPLTTEQATEQLIDSIDVAAELADADPKASPADPAPELALLEEVVELTPASRTDGEPGSATEAVAIELAQQESSSLSKVEEISTAPLSVEQTVSNWVDAWEGQALDVYFSSYHSEFEPRYHNSRSEWRQSRERVIGNANRISLELSDFTIISEDSSSIEVHFWLAYQSPTYQDNTRKKLVLRKQSVSTAEATDRWLIVEEVNLEVRT